MKRFGLSFTLGAATLFPASVIAAASQTMAAEAAAVSTAELSAAEAPTTSGGRMEDLLRRFDTNRDGRIDEAERAAAREAMVKEGVDRQMTRPAGAALSAEELRQRALTLFDEDGDGQLNASERAAARKFVEELATGEASERTAALREAMLKRFDRNANGRIDPDEREQVREVFPGLRNRVSPVAATSDSSLESVVRAAVQQDPEQRARFDTNRDGAIDDSEWATARPELARLFAGQHDGERRDRLAAERERRRQLREKAAERRKAQDN